VVAVSLKKKSHDALDALRSWEEVMSGGTL
jgi:hypothetical protein